MYHRSKTYRFIALTLAFLIFVTSGSFAIDVHYCGGQIKSFNLFGKAALCSEDMQEISSPEKEDCDHHCHMTTESDHTCSSSEEEENDCCQNKTFYFQSDQDQQLCVPANISLVPTDLVPQFIMAYAAVFFGCDFSSQRDEFSLIQYSPPLIYRDIPVLVQSFLF